MRKHSDAVLYFLYRTFFETGYLSLRYTYLTCDFYLRFAVQETAVKNIPLSFVQSFYCIADRYFAHAAVNVAAVLYLIQNVKSII